MNKSMINLKSMYNQMIGVKKIENEYQILKKRYAKKDEECSKLEQDLGTTRDQVAKLKV